MSNAKVIHRVLWAFGLCVTMSAFMDEVFRGLADPSRRMILGLLCVKPRGVSEITAHFAISRPAVSRHLRRLREAGLVSEYKHGRERIYSIEAGRLNLVRDWLEDVMAGAPIGSKEEAPPAVADTSPESVSKPEPEPDRQEVPGIRDPDRAALEVADDPTEDEGTWRQW